MFDYEKLMSEVSGVYDYGLISADDLVFLEEVRDICKGNSCRQYGKTWACPPAVGTYEECKAEAMSYKKGLMFNGKYEIKSPFDWKGMMAGKDKFKAVCTQLGEKINDYIDDYLFLDVEGCDICKECTYPNLPCRFPDKMHSSIEGYGMYVSAIAKKAGIKYDNGEGTVTFLGLILFND